MRRHLALALGLLAALALLPSVATAESPIEGSFELRLGTYKPDVDGPFSGPGPYQSIFGTQRPNAFRVHVAKALPWRALGALELGVGAGWWEVNGRALDAGGQPTTEKTSFKIVPTELTATWRLDLLWERLSIPLVPYARASLQRYNWWITGPGGKTVKTGATNGYAYGGGLALVLDVIDPMLARELDADSGVNHTMVFFDVTRSKVDDFGSTKSFDLSDTQLSYSFGLLFVF